MAFDLNLFDFLKLHKDHPCLLTNPEILPVGAIVVCSEKGFDNAADDVCDLGKVLYAGNPIPLNRPKHGGDHPDGDYGEVFVMSHDKIKRITLEKLSCLLFLFAIYLLVILLFLFVDVLVCHFVCCYFCLLLVATSDHHFFVA